MVCADYAEKVQLANPDQEWKLHSAWFVKQLNFNCTFKAKDIAATAS